MPIHLKALLLQFYRGIGPAKQNIGPFSEMNLFIGANNSGKSTVLNFIKDHLPFKALGQRALQLGPAEEYRGQTTGRLAAAIGVPRKEFISRIEQQLPPSTQQQIGLPGMIEKIVDLIVFDDCVWLVEDRGAEKKYANEIEMDLFLGAFREQDWNRLWSTMTNMRGGGPSNWVTGTLNEMLRLQQVSFPEVAHIPAERNLGERNNSSLKATG